MRVFPGGRRRRALAAGLVLVVASSLVAVLPGSGARAAVGAADPVCPESPHTAFGNPAWVLGCHIGGQGFTSPAIGTIDGVKVIVDASLSGMVYVVNARTGTEMPGWPQAAKLVGNTATAIDSSPAIAYLDGPSRPPSIVVGLGSLYVKGQNGGVMAWNANGTVRFRFQTKKTFAEWAGQPNDVSDAVFATPAIGDITGNGQQDIVFGSFDHYVYALNPEGKLIPGFPILRADTIWSSPALADTTHTGKMDIIEGGDASGWRGPFGGPKCYSGWISDYRYEFGAPHLIWERCLAETVWSSPAVSTFGSTPVVVVGTSWAYGPGRDTQPAEDEIFAFNADTGALMPGWPVNAGGPTFGSPAIAPLVAGGSNDVVESSCAHCLSGPAIVTAWNQAGKQLWRTEISPHSQLVGSPSVASVAGSTTNDVLIGNAAGMFVLDGSNGHPIEGTQSLPINKSCNTEGTPISSAVPGSQTGYMMFTNCGFNGPGIPANNYVRGYNVPAPPTGEVKSDGVSSAAPWPMFRANPERTGVPDPNWVTSSACGPPSTASGYRIVALAGGVYGYGGDKYCGGLAQQILPQDVAGIATTPSGGGYWIALKDGSVYAFGSARSYGDLRGNSYKAGSPDIEPGAPIVGISSTPDGKGYYLLAGDGSVYAFGDAKYQGSEGDYRGNGTPVSIVTDDATGGYWIATSTGHVYNFDATFAGSKPTGHYSPIVGMAAQPSGTGYWLATASGYVFGFGTATVHGDDPGATIVSIAAAQNGKGYYLLDSSGKVHHYWHAEKFGDAPYSSDPVLAISTP